MPGALKDKVNNHDEIGDIGGAIARKLAEQGATTIATYVGNEKGAIELVQSIQDKGGCTGRSDGPEISRVS